MDDLSMPKYFFSKDFCEFEDIFIKYGIKCEFEKDEIISAQGDTLKNSFYIKKGIMQVSVGHEIGKEKTISFMGKGSLFPIGISEHRYKMEYSIVEKAFTYVEAYKLEYEKLRKIVIDNSSLAVSIIEHNCDFTSFLFYEISSLSYDNIRCKVSNILYTLICNGPFENNIIELKQEDIASIIGASRIQVARVLQFLRINNVISTRRNFIEILDIDKLSGMCSTDILDE